MDIDRCAQIYHVLKFECLSSKIAINDEITNTHVKRLGDYN